MSDEKNRPPHDGPPDTPAEKPAGLPDDLGIELDSDKEEIDYISEKSASAPSPGHEPDAEKPLKAKLKKKDAELKHLKKENAELRDQLLRKMAEMDNLKKRLEREKNDYYQYALTDFLKDLLAVLDNLERALAKPDEGDGQSFQEGVRLIHRQFLDAMRKRGVTPILDVVSQRFDPNLHQALATEESDEVTEPRVAEEMQRGYTLHDRLLRPSLVKVRLPRKTQT
jgi:molecular chaperone GrpE